MLQKAPDLHIAARPDMGRELEGLELTLTSVGVSIFSRTAGYIFLNLVLLQKRVLASDSSLVWRRVKRDNLFSNRLFMPSPHPL